MESVDKAVSSHSGIFCPQYRGRIEECFDVHSECENVHGGGGGGGGRPMGSRDRWRAGRPDAPEEEQEEEQEDDAAPNTAAATDQPSTHLPLYCPSGGASHKPRHHAKKALLQRMTDPRAGTCDGHVTYGLEELAIDDDADAGTLAHCLFIGDGGGRSHGAHPMALLNNVANANVVLGGATTSSAPAPVFTSPKHQQKQSRARRHPAANLTVQMGPAPGTTGGGAGLTAAGAGEEDLSPGADSSHDSCYDSDGSLSGSRRGSCARLDAGDLHSDVSRTVSDTLAAEHSETETSNTHKGSPQGSGGGGGGGGSSSTGVLLVKQDTQEFSPSCSSFMEDTPGTSELLTAEVRLSTSASTESLESTGAAPDAAAPAAPSPLVGATGATQPHHQSPAGEYPREEYQHQKHQDHLSQQLKQEELEQLQLEQEEEDRNKVLYGIRLGYSQELTRKVLDKLGPDVKKDELLNELIRHTEDEKDDEYDDEGEAAEPVVCPWVAPTSTAPAAADSRESAAVESKTPLSRRPSDGSAVVGKGATQDSTNLRPIIIDGSNIAMSHGNKQFFSCRGIKLAVDFFRARGHEKITVFVPSWRKEASRQDTQIVDQELLYELEKEKMLVFTPSRRVNGKRIVCYDDLYIIKVAAEDDGVVVSNDNYRDLINKNSEYKKVIEERLLMYSFVNDRFMPPDDPLGRHGPSLDNFLSKQPVIPEPLPPACPYLKKCTYGNKCKYYHPERGLAPRKSVLELLQEQEKVEMEKVRHPTKSRETSPGDVGSRGKSPIPAEQKAPSKKALTKTRSLVPGTKSSGATKMPLSRTKSLAVGSLGMAGGSGGASSAAFPQDSLRTDGKSAAGAGGGSRTVLQTGGDAAGSYKVTVTTASSSEPAEAKRGDYDDLLLKRRDSQSKEATRKNSLSSSASLQLPANWSVSSDVTRPSMQMDTADFPLMATCGHLSLAKKLSDEGKEEEKKKRGLRSSASSPQTSPVRHPAGGQADDLGRNGHKKLERQLSLKNSEDPRLQQVQQSQKQSQPNQRKMYGNPTVMFPGPMRPARTAAPIVAWFDADPSGQNLNNMYAFGNNRAQLSVAPIGHGHRVMQDHATLARHSSMGGEPMYVEQHSHGMHMSPHERQPACRMASAPGTLSQHNSGCGHQQRKSSLVGPTIHRQNSTSDPQLHIHQDNTLELPPSHLIGVQNYHGAHHANVGVMWPRPSLGMESVAPGRTFDNAISNPSGSFDSPLNTHSGSFENIGSGMMQGLEKSRSFESHLSAVEMTYPPPMMMAAAAGMDVDHMSSEHKQHGSDQSLFIQPSPRIVPVSSYSTGIAAHSVASHSNSSDMYSMMAPPPPPPQAPQQQQQPPPPPPPQQPTLPPPPGALPTAGPAQSRSELFVSMMPMRMGDVHSMQHLPSAPSPPHPEDQTTANVPISQGDPRYQVFYHLSKIFPEEKVLDAMYRYPMETQPDKLCRIILDMSH